MKYYFLFYLLWGFMWTGGTLLAYGMMKRKDKYVMHPVSVVKNKLIINLLSSLRVFVFGFTWLIHGRTVFQQDKIYDFGILDYGCGLEAGLGNVIMIYTTLWNLWWTYELYISVKNPMVYSEMNLGIYSKLIFVVGIVLSVLMQVRYEDTQGYTIMCQHRQGSESYKQYIFYPTFAAILICLLINLRYGKSKYLNTFRK